MKGVLEVRQILDLYRERVFSMVRSWMKLILNMITSFLTDLENQRLIIKAIPMYHSIQGIVKHYNTKSNIHFLRESFVKLTEDVSSASNSTLGFSANMSCCTMVK